jgi:lysophospholipase L1-like esterase
MINNSFIMLHNFKSEQKLNLNKAFFLKLIKKALQKHLKVIILTPPLYKTYRSHIPKRVTKEIHGFTSDIMKKYNLKYFDYSDDKRFNIYDYEDDNHLNSSGAKKLSKIINKEIFS